jgi:hypothetical protein
MHRHLALAALVFATGCGFLRTSTPTAGDVPKACRNLESERAIWLTVAMAAEERAAYLDSKRGVVCARPAPVEAPPATAREE